MAMNNDEKKLLEEYKKIYIKNKDNTIVNLVLAIIAVIAGLVLTSVYSSERSVNYYCGLVLSGAGALFTIIILLIIKRLNKKLKEFDNTDCDE